MKRWPIDRAMLKRARDMAPNRKADMHGVPRIVEKTWLCINCLTTFRAPDPPLFTEWEAADIVYESHKAHERTPEGLRCLARGRRAP